LGEMKLAELTWKDVASVDRECVVVIPTGALEQHGPALPLETDARIVTAVAEAVDELLGEKMLLLPTLWLGISPGHLAFHGTLTLSPEAYSGAIEGCIRSLIPCGFWKFYLLNGHGGNTYANGMVLRKLKTEFPNLCLCHCEYYGLIVEEIASILTGADRRMTHGAEAEASLMLHLAPGLVKTSLMRDDGLHSEPSVQGLVTNFNEISSEGSFGAGSEASADKGKALLEAAAAKVAQQVGALADGIVFTSASE